MKCVDFSKTAQSPISVSPKYLKNQISGHNGTIKLSICLLPTENSPKYSRVSCRNYYWKKTSCVSRSTREDVYTMCHVQQERKVYTVPSHNVHIFQISVNFVLNSSNHCRVFSISRLYTEFQ